MKEKVERDESGEKRGEGEVAYHAAAGHMHDGIFDITIPVLFLHTHVKLIGAEEGRRGGGEGEKGRREG